MADTLITSDGRLHTLLGSTTLESVIRNYAGDEAADRVRALAQRNAYEEARAETDLGAYEASLEHWHRMAQDWADELGDLIQHLAGRVTRAELSLRLMALKSSMEEEL